LTLKLFVHGFGYSASALARLLTPLGWSLYGTSRSQKGREALQAQDVTPIDPASLDSLAKGLSGADAMLISAPPGPEGCPGFNALAPLLRDGHARPDWVGYLSTTGVYGDRAAGWVFENSELLGQSPEGLRRIAAERHWQALGDDLYLNTAVFRLPGIYGPDTDGRARSPFGRLRAGTANRFDKPGQVFSRIHVDDIATGLLASMRRPRFGAVYNLCDDLPCPPAKVTEYAARLMGIEPPPLIPFDQADLSPMARRFYAESKRVSNARAKAELGWRPRYPSYREGLAAILKAEAAL
jgi:nucleoside-diphosphate-sugar epimerase